MAHYGCLAETTIYVGSARTLPKRFWGVSQETSLPLSVPHFVGAVFNPCAAASRAIGDTATVRKYDAARALEGFSTYTFRSEVDLQPVT